MRVRPIAIKNRLKIYKEVLNNTTTEGLCFQLKNKINRKQWYSWEDTVLLFPEFGQCFDPDKYKALKFKSINTKDLDGKLSMNTHSISKEVLHSWRIKVLKYCIKECEKLI